jgi:N-methylhydantoinase A
MGLSIEQAAAGMYRVACNNMAQGVREVTIKRGFDPREFPLHPGRRRRPDPRLPDLQRARDPLQIVPREASVLCAFGMLMSELKHDFVRTFVARLDAIDWPRLDAIVDAMTAKAPGSSPRSASPRAAAVDIVRLPLHQAVPRGVGSWCRARLIDKRDAARSPRLPRRAPAPLRLLAGSRERADRDHQRAPAGDRLRPTSPPTARRPGRRRRQRRRQGPRRMYIPERDAFAEVPVYDGHRCAAATASKGRP